MSFSLRAVLLPIASLQACFYDTTSSLGRKGSCEFDGDLRTVVAQETNLISPGYVPSGDPILLGR